MKKKILLTISYDLYGRILQHAEQKEMTASQAIRDILIEHLPEYESKKEDKAKPVTKKGQ